jgi:transposase
MLPSLLTREDALALYASGPEATVSFLLQLQENVVQLQQNVATLQARVGQLETQVGKDSHNSSKPPSSDGLAKKPVSLRPPVGQSGRKSGGQQGHQGRTLQWKETPDEVTLHAPTTCAGCGESLPTLAPDQLNQLPLGAARQVHDLPPQTLQVTEHRTLCQSCPHCQHTTVAQFPDHITQPIQYGPNVAGLCLYLHCYQLLPWARTVQLLGDLWGVSLGQGTLCHLLQRATQKLAPVETAIVGALCKASVVHFDESGMRVCGRLHWLHSASTSGLTFYGCHAKRGRLALDALGILPRFGGVAVHDAYSSYWGYTACAHGLCNAHLLRELIAQHEAGEAWASEVAGLLIEIKAAVARAVTVGETALEQEVRANFERRYAEIVEEALRAHPPPPASGQRGRTPQGDARNLLLRLDKHRASVLRFMSDFAVPFDNNLAERDLRMIKVRQKVSGGFRTLAGSSQFCRIRGYISTLRKQECPLLRALQSLFAGDIFWPPSLEAPSLPPCVPVG